LGKETDFLVEVLESTDCHGGRVEGPELSREEELECWGVEELVFLLDSGVDEEDEL
jgi:hypothetical protein